MARRILQGKKDIMIKNAWTGDEEWTLVQASKHLQIEYLRFLLQTIYKDFAARSGLPDAVLDDIFDQRTTVACSVKGITWDLGKKDSFHQHCTDAGFPEHQRTTVQDTMSSIAFHHVVKRLREAIDIANADPPPAGQMNPLLPFGVVAPYCFADQYAGLTFLVVDIRSQATGLCVASTRAGTKYATVKPVTRPITIAWGRDDLLRIVRREFRRAYRGHIALAAAESGWTEEDLLAEVVAEYARRVPTADADGGDLVVKLPPGVVFRLDHDPLVYGSFSFSRDQVEQHLDEWLDQGLVFAIRHQLAKFDARKGVYDADKPVVVLTGSGSRMPPWMPDRLAARLRRDGDNDGNDDDGNDDDGNDDEGVVVVKADDEVDDTVNAAHAAHAACWALTFRDDGFWQVKE
jgi:hypothetical protein